MATARIRGDTTHFNRAVMRSSKQMQSMANQATRSFGKAGGAINALISPLGLLGGIAAGVGRSFNAFAEVDKSARQVAALIPNAGEAELERIREVAAQTASEFGIGNEAALRGLYEALSAGAPSMEAAAEIMRTAAKASVSAGVDMNEAAKFYTQQSGIWGKTAVEIADLTAATERAGSITTAQLVSDFGRISTQVKLAGVNIEEVMAQIATLTQAGVVPNEAITQLGRLYQEVVNPESKLFQAIIKATGKDFKTLVAEGKNVGEILQDVKADTGDLFVTMFGRETAARGAQVLIDKIDVLNEKTRDLNSAQGELANNFKRAEQSAAFSIAQMKQAWEDLKLALGEAVAPALTEMLKETAESFKELAKDPEFAKGLAELASSLSKHIPELVKLGPTLLQLSDTVAGLAVTMAKVARLIPPGATDDMITAFLLYKTLPKNAAGSVAVPGWISRRLPQAGATAAAGRNAATAAYMGGGGAVATSTAVKAAGTSAGVAAAKSIGKGLVKGASRWALPVFIGNELIRGITNVDVIGAITDTMIEGISKGLLDWSVQEDPTTTVTEDPEGNVTSVSTRTGAPRRDSVATLSNLNIRELMPNIDNFDIDSPLGRELNRRRSQRMFREFENATVGYVNELLEFYEIRRSEQARFIALALKAEREYWADRAKANEQSRITLGLGIRNFQQSYSGIEEFYTMKGQAHTSAYQSEKSSVATMAAQVEREGTIAQQAELDARLAEAISDGELTRAEIRSLGEWLQKILEVDEDSLDVLDQMNQADTNRATYYAPVTVGDPAYGLN